MLLVAIFVVAWPGAAFAHAPHDEITAIQVSPGFLFDQTLFAIVRGNLVRSLDAGLTWWRVTKGLPREVLERVFLSPRFSDDGRAFLTTEGSGFYLSGDGGVSWSRRVEDHLAALTELSFSPEFPDDGAMAACDRLGGLHLSTDAGQSWRSVPLPDRRAAAVLLAPAALLVGTDDGSLLVMDRDGIPVDETEIEGGAITCMAMAEEGFVAIGTSRRGIALCTLSSGGGAQLVRHGVDGQHVTAICAYNRAVDSTTLLATTWRKGAYLSTDGGRSWERRAQGLTTDHQADDPAFARPHFSCVAVSPAGGERQLALIGGFDGLFRSADGCRTWAELKGVLSEGLIVAFDVARSSEGSSIAVASYCQGLFTRRVLGGERWVRARTAADHKRFHGFAYSPSFAVDHTAFTATHGFALRSRDGGESWASVPLTGSSAGPPNRHAARRLRVQRIGRTIFARLPKGLRDRLRPLIEKAGLNAELKRFSVYGSVFRLSPAFAQDGLVYLGCARHGIFQSIDGGGHFALLWNTASDSLWDMALSPDFPADRTMFAALASGIHRSCDRGLSWERLSDDPRLARGRLAVSPDFARDNTLYLGSACGLFRSVDAGRSWQGPIEIDGASGPIGALALSPDFAIDREVLVYPIGRRLYRSRDGGARFEVAGADDAGLGLPLSQMTGFFDYPAMIRYAPDYPADPTLYVSTVDGLHCSRDGGKAWTSLALPARDADAAGYSGGVTA